MILELKIQNFRSFEKETVISFEATADTTLEEYYTFSQPDGTRILKMMMIYGANASGKTNLIQAFDFLNEFVHAIPEDKEEDTGFIPFLFNSDNNETGNFELTFYVEGVKYKYVLSIDIHTVWEEKLLYYPGKRPAVVFDRSFDKERNISVVNFGPKVKLSSQATEAILLKTLKNTSVFAAYSQVNLSVPLLDGANGWFRRQFLMSIDPYTSLTAYSDEHIRKDLKLKTMALDFIQRADFNIADILFEEQVRQIPEQLMKMIENAPIPEEDKDKIRKEKAIHLNKTMFLHKVIREQGEAVFSLPDELQSRGTMRYYGLSAPFFQTIRENAFLPIDEIGSALHPLLVIHFLKEFLSKSDQAQMLFTTHNLSLLNEKDILRKDAIWFTEKGETGASSLYSMAEFNIRKELSYYNAYKIGKFGAIPKID